MLGLYSAEVVELKIFWNFLYRSEIIQAIFGPHYQRWRVLIKAKSSKWVISTIVEEILLLDQAPFSWIYFVIFFWGHHCDRLQTLSLVTTSLKMNHRSWTTIIFWLYQDSQISLYYLPLTSLLDWNNFVSIIITDESHLYRFVICRCYIEYVSLISSMC